MVLSDGTVVCWMTANGKLSASFSCDGGEHWHVDSSSGRPHMLDPEFYGYPGGMLLEDESICVVYYDAVSEPRKNRLPGLSVFLSVDNQILQVSSD